MTLQEMTRDELIAYAAELQRKLAKTEQTQIKLEQAEEALRENQDKYRLVVDKALEGILVAQEGMLRLVNPKAVEIIGRT